MDVQNKGKSPKISFLAGNHESEVDLFLPNDAELTPFSYASAMCDLLHVCD